MSVEVVITGIGLVTPLGAEPRDVLRRIEAGEKAARAPGRFDASPFACRVCAEIPDFRPQPFVPEPKLVRLMNRDAQLAVAAAQLAIQDARLAVGADYLPEDIALFGAAGTVGLPLREVAPLLRASTRPDGRFDPELFGRAGLRAVSPLLSFKILSNMPVCFVSICANLQGANAIYTPWEGQGAQAIEAGRRALTSGDARCAVVGGCDVKTHELAFIGLEQHGLFRSWAETGAGPMPGEGAAFLVLERASDAAARGARIYARLAGCALPAEDGATALHEQLGLRGQHFSTVVAAANGDHAMEQIETRALATSQITADAIVCPKRSAGDLFAAAATLQVALAALLAARRHGQVLAHCLGHGSEQAAFVLAPP
jgi:3-oxoacyl-[acyl-carrier-protein] synthase II